MYLVSFSINIPALRQCHGFIHLLWSSEIPRKKTLFNCFLFYCPVFCGVAQCVMGGMSWLIPEKNIQKHRNNHFLRPLKIVLAMISQEYFGFVPGWRYVTPLCPHLLTDWFHDTNSGFVVPSIIKCTKIFMFQSTKTSIDNLFSLNTCNWTSSELCPEGSFYSFI